MGFNFGALGSGLSEGLQSGTQMADQMQMRKLRQAQLGAFNAGQQGQQAWVNSMIPGAQPMPQGAQHGGVVPILSNLPLVGAIGRELGLWGDTPQSAQQPQAGGQAGGAPSGPGFVPSPSGPPQGQSPAPQGGQPAQPAPQAAPQPQQPAASALPITPDIVAAAIDRANPGLRASNPAAFAQAVQLGLAHAQQMTKTQLDTDLTRSQIAGQNAENQYKGAQTANLQGPQADLTRATTENTRAQTEVHKGQALLAPAKQKLEEAKQKLEELKADQAQRLMGLQEAEMNAKIGDFASQRSYRDAQIANFNADQKIKTQEQKIKEAEANAKIEHMGAQSKEATAHAGLYESQSGKDGVSAARDKEVNVALGKAQVQLRHYENMKSHLLQSVNPNEPRVKALMQEVEPFIQQNRARVQELEGQLSTAHKALAQSAPQAAPEIPAPRQQELSKISSKMLELEQADDREGGKKLVAAMKAKGMPDYEIQWALRQAQAMSNSAKNKPQSPQVPQSR